MSTPPDSSIQQVVKLCNAEFISISGPDIMQFIKQNPAYQSINIPGGTYTSNPAPVATFGVKATLITSEEMDEELVYIIVRTLFENLDRLKRIHPAPELECFAIRSETSWFELKCLG